MSAKNNYSNHGIRKSPFRRHRFRIVVQWISLSFFVCGFRLVQADEVIGVLSFWVPELWALLEVFRQEGNTVIQRVFGGRRFYITSFRGHNLVAVNGGESITNSAATVAILLQKFPQIKRIVGSGIAGGVDPNLRIGDVVIPERWALYQEDHFARILENGAHDLGDHHASELLGENCGFMGNYIDYHNSSSFNWEPCNLGVNTWNYSFMYPVLSYGANHANPQDPTIEKTVPYKWFYVDPEMLAIAAEIASNVTLSRGKGNAQLDYQPVVLVGGNGVAGSSFVDNAEYREYVYNTFRARALDMETAATAHAATQFGVKFIFFRSLSDLAGADEVDNALTAFYEVASANAVATLSTFLVALTPDNHPEDPLPKPKNHFPGEDTPDLLGILVFHPSGLAPLKDQMVQEGGFRDLVFGGRRFYRGKMTEQEVVVALTGKSTSNAAMTTALMIQLYPGVNRIVGSGLAKVVDPKLQLGDVVIPDRFALYQEQLLAKEPKSNLYIPLPLETKHLVGRNCGGFDGVSKFLTGNRQCDATLGECSNFGFFFPKTVQTPEPRSTSENDRLSEGFTRKWWFDVDEEMLEAANAIVSEIDLHWIVENGSQPYYTPRMHVGGNALTGPTYVDNDGYRRYLLREFEARSVDSEAGAVAHIAYQNDVPFLFFHSLMTPAGSGERLPNSFYNVTADNGRNVILTLITALNADPLEKTRPPASGERPNHCTYLNLVLSAIVFLFLL